MAKKSASSMAWYTLGRLLLKSAGEIERVTLSEGAFLQKNGGWRWGRQEEGWRWWGWSRDLRTGPGGESKRQSVSGQAGLEPPREDKALEGVPKVRCKQEPFWGACAWVRG